MNRSLTDLDIGDNDIGHVGASAIAAGLTMNDVLTKLTIRNNYFIGTAGAEALAECLKVPMIDASAMCACTCR